MNKAELIEAVAAQMGDRRTAGTAVEATLDAIQRTVVAGEKVALSGFGVFEKVDRPARTARNPATGESIALDETSVPRFRPGTGFKDVVRGVRELPELPPVQEMPVPARARRAPAGAGAPTQEQSALDLDGAAVEAAAPAASAPAPAAPVGTQGDPLLDVVKGLDGQAAKRAASKTVKAVDAKATKAGKGADAKGTKGADAKGTKGADAKGKKGADAKAAKAAKAKGSPVGKGKKADAKAGKGKKG